MCIRDRYDEIKEIFWASGACFLIRSKVFWRLGGFDNDFFAHQEEIDLCWRAHNLNFRVLAVGTSKVYHIGGSTLPISAKKTYLNHRNSLIMIVKNVPNKNLYSILFFRLILDGFIGLLFSLKFKFSFAWAIIRAHYAFFKVFKYVKKKNIDEIKRNDYFFVENILLEYFFKKKTLFHRFK